MSTTTLRVHLDADDLATLLHDGSVEPEVSDDEHEMPVGTMLLTADLPESRDTGMGSIVLIEGIALKELIDALTDSDTYRLRVAIDGGGLKIKRNEGTWTLPYGVVEVRA